MVYSKNICIQICDINEWQSVKNILKFDYESLPSSPFGEFYSTKIAEHNCLFFHSGSIKSLAAAACQYAIDKWNPEILFVLGTAGGVADNLNPLDIVLANRTEQYDCISRMGAKCELFHKDSATVLDNSWINMARIPFGMHEGAIATADQDIDYEVRMKLQPFHILIADWESGAIAPVCKVNNIRCCIIRGVSDVPKLNDTSLSEQFSQFQNNIHIIMENLIVSILPEMLKHIK